jgi:outer membrane putative beta-barrel porin/alpha-amylase
LIVWSRARAVVTGCAAVAFGASVVLAGEPDRIVTDRPSVSNSASTVPPGAFQIESGLEYSRARVGGAPDERRFSLDVTLRAGITEHVEVAVEGEPFVRLRGADDDTGNGDVALKGKYRFLDSREGRAWPALAVQPFVTLPVAHAPHGPDRPDFGLMGLATFDLPWQLGLDVNAGLAARAQTRPSDYLVQGLVSAALARELGERWSTYVEVFYASAAERGGRDIVGVDAGAQFFLTRRVALDAAVETALAGPGPDYAFRAGLSVRFGK